MKLENVRQVSGILASQKTPTASFVGVDAAKKLRVVTLIEGSHWLDDPCGLWDAELIEGAPLPVTFTVLSFSELTRAEILTSKETGSVSRAARGTSIKPFRSLPAKVFELESS
jgi:hypothetical protein